MPDHIVSAFDADLGELRRGIAEMGGIAEKMLSDAMSALVRDHAGLARNVIAEDPRLDDLQRLIEERGILTIARRQPLAVDLREVIAALRIASDLDGPYADPQTYWRSWLATLEAILETKEVAGRADLTNLQKAWRRAAEATPHGQSIHLTTRHVGFG